MQILLLPLSGHTPSQLGCLCTKQALGASASKLLELILIPVIQFLANPNSHFGAHQMTDALNFHQPECMGSDPKLSRLVRVHCTRFYVHSKWYILFEILNLPLNRRVNHCTPGWRWKWVSVETMKPFQFHHWTSLGQFHQSHNRAL